MTTTYRLRPEAWASARAKLLRRMGWTLLYGQAVGVLISFLLLRPTPPLALILIVQVLIAGALVYGGWQQFSRMRAGWTSYVLEFGEDSVLRRHREVADLRLRRDEVTRILEQPGEGMSLLTAQPTRFVNIPETVENYAEVRDQLARWRPIERVDQKFALQWVAGAAMGLLFVGLWLAVGLVPDVKLAMIPGAVLLVCCVVAGLKVRGWPLAKSQKAILLRGLVMMSLAVPARIAWALMTAP